MASIWDYVVETYDYIINELSHPLTKNWFLIQSPFPILAIAIAYNVFCIKIGHQLMKNRPPFKLNKIINFYNTFQVVVNAYVVYEGYFYLFHGDFNFLCEGPNEVIDKRFPVVRTFYLYFLIKLLDMLDTIFFVLRKSERQITFLHLYHHTLMLCLSWYTLKYYPSGQPAVIGTINSLVHVFMYIYYLLAGLGPKYQKYLWWKHYLTLMQIAQFAVILIHSFNSLFYTCDYPAALKLLSIIEAVTFIYMFSQFYYRNYILKRHLERNKNYTNGTSNAQHNSNGQPPSTKSDEDYNPRNSNVDSDQDRTVHKNDSNGKINGNYSNGKSKSKVL